MIDAAALMEALNGPLDDDLDSAYLALSERDESRALATLYAALADAGWTGEPADYVVTHAAAGVTERALDAARKAADKITDPWSAWDDLPTAASNGAHALRDFLRKNDPWVAGMPASGGVVLDLDAPPEPPKWLVKDFLVRGSTHMLSGGVGSFKSGLREHMMAASLTGGRFLGRPVDPLRWLIIEGENSDAHVRKNWRAAGLRPEHLTSIHYTPRSAVVRLGEPKWNDWLRREAAAFKPDVIVIDTIVRVCAGINSMDQDSVAALYAELLVPLVDEHDAALVFTAHHRKSGGRKGTDDAVNGSTQWAGQAEQTMTVATTGPLKFDGQETQRSFVLHRPKGRDIVDPRPEHFTVRGRLDADGALLERTVSLPKAEDVSNVQRLVAALSDGPLGAGAMADRAGLHRTGKGIQNARQAALDEGLIVRNDDGLFTLAED